MRIFVLEYITGGGQTGAELNAALAAEAELMLNALLCDLADVADVELLVSRDARLPPLNLVRDVFVPAHGEDVWAQWTRCIDACDAVWPIMPETGGLLERISELVLARRRTLLGSTPAAVNTAAGKFRTLQRLREAGIAAVPAWRAADEIPFLPGRWVAKPDDGVGCDGIRVFDDHAALCAALRVDRERYADYIVQPFVQGLAASLSLLCAEGRACLLAVNAQRIVRERGRLKLVGLAVNGLPGAGPVHAELAAAVAAALPGLWGYAGVDFIMTPAGPVVLEVNPRLTVSYAGIRAALAINPAAEVVRMARGAPLPASLPVYDADRRADIVLEFAHVA